MAMRLLSPFDTFEPAPDALGPDDELAEGPVCVGCGCDDLNACPGGCIWATANLCSQCALGTNAAAASLASFPHLESPT
ncbi:MAG TPA: hypothetical protein VGI39_16870 [Polyangiaceae bacterium]|jgi:hypothetical protein